MDETAKEIDFLDRFVITYFKVLPTDKRFKDLTEDTKELLFFIFVNTPTGSEHLALLKEDILRRSLQIDDSVIEIAEKMGIDLDAAVAAIKGGG